MGACRCRIETLIQEHLGFRVQARWSDCLVIQTLEVGRSGIRIRSHHQDPFWSGTAAAKSVQQKLLRESHLPPARIALATAMVVGADLCKQYIWGISSEAPANKKYSDNAWLRCQHKLGSQERRVTEPVWQEIVLSIIYNGS